MNNWDTSNDTFAATLKAQMDLEQPVLFTLPGHMVVVDGYSDDSSGEYVHINMGWGESTNTFYNISENITAGSFNFTTSYTMTYDIKPCSEANGDCYKNLESGDSIDGLNISGSFNWQTDSDNHSVYLKGYTEVCRRQGIQQSL